MKRFLVQALFILFSAGVYAQAQPPFRNEIDAFRHEDSLHMPAPGAILFVGSSSFTKWKDVQDYFPGYRIINRGFGGSSLTDVIRYTDEIIVPYHPKQIVIYCGENDVAASDTITAGVVLSRVKELFALIRSRLPNTPIAYISIKPSVSRWKYEPVFVQANVMIKRFIRTRKNAAFIDVHSAMLRPDGSVMPDIFVSDNLHMNAKGYHIWQPIIRKYLLK